MRGHSVAALASAMLLAASCAHKSLSVQEWGTIAVTAAVTISGDGAGGYLFEYKGPFFDEKGNFDFSKQGAAFNIVDLTFSIAGDSIDGIRFMPDPTDAMWIVEKINVDAATGSPRGAYRGEQFANFRISSDRQQLTVTDHNNDGVLYRYGLRFDLDGEVVFDDPDGKNGGPGY